MRGNIVASEVTFPKWLGRPGAHRFWPSFGFHGPQRRDRSAECRIPPYCLRPVARQAIAQQVPRGGGNRSVP